MGLRMATCAGKSTVKVMSSIAAVKGQLRRTEPDPAALVELSGIGRRYAVGSGEVVALVDVSIQVAAEDFVVVLGPSGSGKTTLLSQPRDTRKRPQRFITARQTPTMVRERGTFLGLPASMWSR
jgi:ABC-type glutathione transport system ATPase component